MVVNEGDKVAQLVCEKCAIPMVVEANELSHSEREAAGFGSSGTSSLNK